MKKSLIFKKNRLYYLNQVLLPHKERYEECRGLSDGFMAIKKLKVRGAPLIGVFSAYCVYVAVRDLKTENKDTFFRHLKKAVSHLKNARPTAVNLSWAVERVYNAAIRNRNEDIRKIKEIILKEAKSIHREDIQLCSSIAKNGIKLIKKGDTILTHCNTGFLATSGDGTALGIIYAAAKKGKNIKVYACEARPLLQGARLTSWELKERKINSILICDDMAAYLMQQKKIDKVFVGADRIARNGDTANKIGTYNLAVLANYHKIPFYVVSPSTSFDLNIERGEDIPIEERAPSEVRVILGKLTVAPKVRVYNPAFDVTPHRLISAIVTDRGIIYPSFKKSIRNLLKKRF